MYNFALIGKIWRLCAQNL